MKITIKGFEDLIVWQDSMTLVTLVYQALSGCRDWGFRDQIQRASISIPSNISEGFDRMTNKEFIHFLYIANGSCAEVRTQLQIAINLQYLSSESGSQLINRTKQISSMLKRLIQVRKEKF